MGGVWTATRHQARAHGRNPRKRNGMVADPDGVTPPGYRYAERDHLHDVTRENAVFDPANLASRHMSA